jgi:plastocyanin
MSAVSARRIRAILHLEVDNPKLLGILDANWGEVMAAFSIKIVGTPAVFDPPEQSADRGDVISWNNTTDVAHEIFQITDTQELALLPIGGDRWRPIPPRSSSPAWTVPLLPSGTKIQYRCLRHLNEIGTIKIN